MEEPPIADWELALARRDPSVVPGGLASLLHDDFVEVGASGRRWTRDEIVAMLEAETGAARDAAIDGLDVLTIGRDARVATYRITIVERAERRTSRRSSVWVRTAGRWLLRFHQGTPIR